MAQVKKPEVRDAILDAAFRLFAAQGYTATTLAGIAEAAGVSTANVYVYFASKLEVLYEMYAPWMRARLERLEEELAACDEPADRIRHLLATLWREIPAAQNGFANNIMQAISTASAGDGYRPTLLHWMEARLAGMLEAALPAARRRVANPAEFAHLIIMAFDGFIIYHHLNPARPCSDAMLDSMSALLLGDDIAPQRAGAKLASAKSPHRGRSRDTTS